MFFAVFGIVMKQCCTKYKLDPLNGLDTYYINHLNGDLHLTFSEPVQYDKYCVDNTLDTESGEVTQEIFLCFEDNRETEFYIYSAGLCFSSIFLILTISVYVCSPKVSREEKENNRKIQGNVQIRISVDESPWKDARQSFGQPAAHLFRPGLHPLLRRRSL